MNDHKRTIDALAARVRELERAVAGIPSRFALGGGGGGGSTVGFYVVVAASASTITARRVTLNGGVWEASPDTITAYPAPGSVPLDYGGRWVFGPGTVVDSQAPIPFLGVSDGAGHVVLALPLKPNGQAIVPDNVDLSA